MLSAFLLGEFEIEPSGFCLGSVSGSDMSSVWVVLKTNPKHCNSLITQIPKRLIVNEANEAVAELTLYSVNQIPNIIKSRILSFHLGSSAP